MLSLADVSFTRRFLKSQCTTGVKKDHSENNKTILSCQRLFDLKLQKFDFRFEGFPVMNPDIVKMLLIGSSNYGFTHKNSIFFHVQIAHEDSCSKSCYGRKNIYIYIYTFKFISHCFISTSLLWAWPHLLSWKKCLIPLTWNINLPSCVSNFMDRYVCFFWGLVWCMARILLLSPCLSFSSLCFVFLCRCYILLLPYELSFPLTPLSTSSCKESECLF